MEFKRVCPNPDHPDIGVLDDDLGVPEFHVPDTRSKARAFVDGSQQQRIGGITPPTLSDVAVQDTDFAYRPRITYDDARAYGFESAWTSIGGECVDEVLRGCYNNGTCVAPDTCRCADGWSGHDCSVPVCDEPCQHNGNCTMPGADAASVIFPTPSTRSRESLPLPLYAIDVTSSLRLRRLDGVAVDLHTVGDIDTRASRE